MLCLLQKLRVSAVIVAHSIPVKPPGLSTGPCRFMSKSLVGFFASYFSSNRIVIYYVVRTVVWPKMMLHGGKRMGIGRLPVNRLFKFCAGPVQVLQVHHIVYDHRELPVVAKIPGADHAGFGAKTVIKMLRTLF